MTFQKQHECLSLTFIRIFFVWSAGGSKCVNEYSVPQNQFLSHALSVPMKDWQAHQQLPLINALRLWPEKNLDNSFFRLRDIDLSCAVVICRYLFVSL